MNKTLTILLQEVMKAYSDCNGYRCEKNLHFRAKDFCSRDEAIEIMGRAIPDGYNEFDASLLKSLPEDSQVTIAREYSVCIYVRSQEEMSSFDLNKLKAAELNQQKTGEVRIWWE